MKLKALLLGDLRLQFKYGFYFLYVVFSILYICILFALPEAWRGKTSVLLIFSDPAAIGLFFMGALILFEKGERALDSIAISPIRPYEYILSKVLSIALISTIVALTIGIPAQAVQNPFYFIIGVFLCSCLFSAVGLIAAAKSISLNDFMLAAVPAELLINIPAIAYLFRWDPGWLLLHPGASTIELLQNGRHSGAALAVLAVWTVLIAMLANRAVVKMFKSLGGIKL